MPTNIPIDEDRVEVYCNACQRYTGQWKNGKGCSPYGVMELARNILEGYGNRPEHLDCGDCVTSGVYGNKKLITSMKKLCAGADAKTRKVVRQSVGEFRAEVRGTV